MSFRLEAHELAARRERSETADLAIPLRVTRRRRDGPLNPFFNPERETRAHPTPTGKQKKEPAPVLLRGDSGRSRIHSHARPNELPRPSEAARAAFYSR